jgi:hypothetical protein
MPPSPELLMSCKSQLVSSRVTGHEIEQTNKELKRNQEQTSWRNPNCFPLVAFPPDPCTEMATLAAEAT